MFFWGSYTTARLKPGPSTKIFYINSFTNDCPHFFSANFTAAKDEKYFSSSISKFPSKLPNDVSISKGQFEVTRKFTSKVPNI